MTSNKTAALAVNGAVKLADVARLANVSISTDSRALTRPEMVSPETREAVAEIARLAGYQPNLIARSLRTQTSKTVLVLVPNLDSLFYPEIIRGLDWTAHGRGYAIMLGLTGGDSGRQASYVNAVRQQRADGMIILDCRLDQLVRNGTGHMPMVQVLDRVEGVDQPSVTIDDRNAARTVTQHLIALGHRRIGHILGMKSSSTTGPRLEGYRDALKAAGITPDATLLAEGNFMQDEGMAAAARLLDLPAPPTAIFCANDESALGAMIACQRRGLRIPEEISIAGFDGIEQGANASPPLTTVRQPRFGIGVAAMSMMIDTLEGKPPANKHATLPVEFIPRQSTAAPKG